ncbi:MAG: AMP-binding protein [Butyrivibrio sp.]|nr:AMP-binding protein [Butyrivibrio sp.]
MVDRIKCVAERFPDRIAYRVAGNEISYKELWELSNKYSGYIRKQGVTPVMIYGHKSIGMMTAVLSCLLAGRAYVPVEAGTPLYRIKKIIGATGASLMICEEAIGDAGAGDGTAAGTKVGRDNAFDGVKCVSLQELKDFAGSCESFCGQDAESFDVEKSSGIAYMIFTSGSTGEPKGVPISVGNLDNFASWISGITPLCNYDGITVYNQASFSFDLSVADLYYSLCNGHTLLSFAGNITDDYEGFFSVFKDADVAVMTPSYMRLCLLDDYFNAENFPRFKCVYFCGERLEVKTVKKLFERFPDIRIINAYGPTECTSAVTAVLITKEMAETMPVLPVGEIKNAATEVEIRDGEIVLKGKSVFGGYIGGLQGGHFKEGDKDCYRTGDIGYIEDGLLFCKGRADSQIKFMGFRIELLEIERNINMLGGVRNSAVVACYDANGSVKAIKAYVEAEPFQDARAIKKGLEERLPYYMIPKTVKIVECLPLNANGKIDRKALERL